MGQGIQSHVLAVLAQVEEMFICHANPILQVMHACGGQYKYFGYTICFPQDIYVEIQACSRLISLTAINNSSCKIINNGD